MTKTRKAGVPAIGVNRKNGSSIRVAVAGLSMLLTVLVGTARNSTARRDPETRSADLKMLVRVYNYAGISADMLRFAEGDAAGIFAQAGVRLEWHECAFLARAESADSACAAPLKPSDLQLRIVNGMKSMRIQASGEIAGFTMGSLATVPLEPLLELGRRTGCVYHQIVGRAIAHELGHAMLGGGHSPQGIMQASWGQEQLVFTAARDLVFTPDQEKALRLAVKARSGQ